MTNYIAARDLPAAAPGSPLAAEWETYRAMIGKLLAEGSANRFVVIKGNQIEGIYDSWLAARKAGLKQFQLQPFLVQQIRSEEPMLRVRGHSLPCPI